jgi:hypothetical protein
MALLFNNFLQVAIGWCAQQPFKRLYNQTERKRIQKTLGAEMHLTLKSQTFCK